MCLDTIDEKTKNWKSGWKVFKYEDGNLLPLYWFGWEVEFPQHKYPVGKWFKDTSLQEFAGVAPEQVSYPCGIHFFRTRRGAVSESIRRKHDFKKNPSLESLYSQCCSNR